MNLARNKGYKTVENATKKLEKIVGKLSLSNLHHVIAVNAAGRFVPCLLNTSPDTAYYCHHGITCLS